MVLCVEVVDAAFGTAFKAFLGAGGYKAHERSTGDKEFYRFHKLSDQSFPFMIELFSRKSSTLDLPESAELTTIPVGEDIVSLSAILLDDRHYEALQSAKRKLEGVTVIDETLLIPFKARAFLDLSARAEAGEKIDNNKKHRNDVFRLTQLLPGDASITGRPWTWRQKPMQMMPTVWLILLRLAFTKQSALNGSNSMLTRTLVGARGQLINIVTNLSNRIRGLMKTFRISATSSV